jgi:F-type H+-transporting ATPase subunit epsilon
MRLRLLIPTQVVVDQDVARILAEGEHGCFCLLPRHVDFLAALVPSLLSFLDESGTEQFVAIDEGILVKQGNEVLVSTGQAVRGGDLGQLRDVVAEQFSKLDDRERAAHAAVAKLEASFLRGYLALTEDQR